MSLTNVLNPSPVPAPAPRQTPAEYAAAEWQRQAADRAAANAAIDAQIAQAIATGDHAAAAALRKTYAKAPPTSFERSLAQVRKAF